jgi:peptidyl-dipeptidase Dcp
MNILDKNFDFAPFNSIKTEYFSSSVDRALEKLKSEIYAITSNKAQPTFNNTIVALEESGDKLDRITSIFFNLNSADTNEEIQKIAFTISPKLSDLKNFILFNEILFNKVEIVFKKNNKNLSVEQRTLLDNTYRSFVRNGSKLNYVDKEKLKEIDKKLSKLSLDFGQNLLKETNNYELNIINKNKLNGLSDDHLEAAKSLAESKNKKGWLFTLEYPSYSSLITYCSDRNIRKEISIAYGKRAFQNNKYDNQKIILDIINLRFTKSKILGFNNYSEYVLEQRMAKNPDTVMGFLNEIFDKVLPVAKKEFEELSLYATKCDGITKLQKWDIAYYSEKLKKNKFQIDQELLKPFFSLDNVLQGVFEISNKLYDLKFKEIFHVDKYHPDVKTFEVTDKNNNFISLLYTDFYPRKSKRGGAWMTSYKQQSIRNKKNSRPHISIVCNFTKPTKDKPSLLTFNEVTTLFHEFGHALHGILANTKYKSLSGTNVLWDFVELPSQLFENWCYEEKALNIFAKHYETGKKIPIELIKKIKNSSNFNQASQTLRQLSFALLDINWHNSDPSSINSVKDFEDDILNKYSFTPNFKETCMSTSFSHIFQGGYSSGYYSYKWAEVLDADAFEYFKSEGVFNKRIASKFKNNILKKGGTQNPMDLYIKFRGRKPKIEALLKRSAITK